MAVQVLDTIELVPDPHLHFIPFQTRQIETKILQIIYEISTLSTLSKFHN